MQKIRNNKELNLLTKSMNFIQDPHKKHLFTLFC
jgi:hypothetical protein